MNQRSPPTRSGSYCTFSVNVPLLCTVPAVAVTVTTDVVGTCTIVELAPLLQPETSPIPRALRAITSTSFKRRRLPRSNRQSAAVTPPAGKNGLGPCRSAANDVVVETVSVALDAAVPDTVKLIGEKVQPASAGSPEQASETAEENPYSGVTATVTVLL